MVDVRNGAGELSSTKLDNQANADARPTGDSALNNDPGSNALDDMAPSKASSKASSTRPSTPAAASLEDGQPPKSANGSPAPTEQAPQSQPMSKTASSSSNPTAKDARETPAAPYGTRSRNRPERTSRVNYAEDVEMDFEIPAAPSNGTGSEPPSRASVVTENGQAAGAGGKKGSGAAQGNASWGASGPNPRDIPPNANVAGTSPSTGNPATTPAPQPKRRKNAASHATNAGHANAAPPSQGGARRTQTAAATNTSTSQSPRETNMLTFESTGARLKNGCLVADDGQTIAINGKW